MGAAGKALELLSHPDELKHLARMYFEAKRVKALTLNTPHHQFCYDIINKVSRSFAIVIQQLPPCLRDAVCVFYLVLRALDTVEDDMALANDVKLPMLHAFHDKISDPAFCMTGCGEKDYKVLLEQFPLVTKLYLSLSAGSRAVIKDITQRMGDGMAEFIEKDVLTVADYDQYCHYVAGLVGVGLCRLFSSSGCEPDFKPHMLELANDMGLFLQKTNIIRDYLEDILEEPAPRMFWPREIWGKYAATLADFKEPENRAQAIKCLNHMVTDALRHAPRCLEYMATLTDRQVFVFCAIPQVMAMSTLALCYNNGKVFEGVVKMRRGQTAKVFTSVSSMGELCQHFHQWAVMLKGKMADASRAGDPNAEDGLARAQAITADCRDRTQRLGVPLVRVSSWQPLQLLIMLCNMVLVLDAPRVQAILAQFGLPVVESSAVLSYKISVVVALNIVALVVYLAR